MKCTCCTKKTSGYTCVNTAYQKAKLSDSSFASITNDDERNLRNGVSMLSKKSRHLDKTRGQYTLL